VCRRGFVARPNTVFPVLTALLSNVSLSASEVSTFMKRSLLAVLFAITLSLAARADTLDFSVGSGSLTYPPFAPPPTVVAPSFSASLGSGLSMQGVLPSWLGLPDTGGNSFSLVQNGVTIFQGVFTSDTVVKNVTLGAIVYQIDATISEVGHPRTLAFLVFESTPINMNNVFCRNPGAQNGGAFCNTGIAGGFLEILIPTPEPGTLGLIGTGILGIFGVVRKKLTLRPTTNTGLQSVFF
jgi:hypothetical protein